MRAGHWLLGAAALGAAGYAAWRLSVPPDPETDLPGDPLIRGLLAPVKAHVEGAVDAARRAQEERRRELEAAAGHALRSPSIAPLPPTPEPHRPADAALAAAPSRVASERDA